VTLEQSIDTTLRADATLAASLGNRIYWIQIPQTAIVPYLVYTTIADTDQPEAFGDTNTGQARIQFDVVTASKADKSIMYRIRDILRGKSFTSLSIRHVAPVQFRDRFDGSTMRYIFSLDMEFTHGY
jgi:hypothetical protein